MELVGTFSSLNRTETSEDVDVDLMLTNLDPAGDDELCRAGRHLLTGHHDLLELAAAHHNPAVMVVVYLVFQYSVIPNLSAASTSSLAPRPTALAAEMRPSVHLLFFL